MTKPASERLFGLLPAVHRLRDAENGHPLRALLAVLESELIALEEATQAQYENWFIETCDDSAVPRIGELLGLPVAPAGTGHPPSSPKLDSKLSTPAPSAARTFARPCPRVLWKWAVSSGPGAAAPPRDPSASKACSKNSPT